MARSADAWVMTGLCPYPKSGLVVLEIIGCTRKERGEGIFEDEMKTARVFLLEYEVEGCKVRPYHADSKLFAQGKGC